jgi:hypothetical protein
MSDKKQILRQIKERLGAVNDHMKNTEQLADSVGDKSGAASIRKAREEVQRTQKEFEGKDK